jgi:alkanesulfonate monooxygenase SsuD/methylene tetrahydromethanopterin reductase-like flavin-dependent oxidoreductase (luciferase family)
MDGGVDPSAGDTAWTEPDHHLPAVAAAGYYITPGARPDASRPHWTPRPGRRPGAVTAQGREAAGLRSEPLAVAAGPLTVAADDPALARRISTSCLAWYLCAMGDVYARSLTGQGYGDAVRAILDANPHPRPHAGVVPAGAQVVLDELTANGTPRQVRDQLAGWDAAVDLTMLGLPPGLPWDLIETTLRAAAP